MLQYSDDVLERYYDSKYVGMMDASDPDVRTGQAGTPESGEVVRIQMKVNAQGIIEVICFKAHGSCATIAAAAYVCEQLHGQPVSQIDCLSAEGIVNALNLPKVKVHSALLAIDSATIAGQSR